jgi:hypothetical protein
MNSSRTWEGRWEEAMNLVERRIAMAGKANIIQEVVERLKSQKLLRREGKKDEITKRRSTILKESLKDGKVISTDWSSRRIITEKGNDQLTLVPTWHRLPSDGPRSKEYHVRRYALNTTL